MPRKAYSFFRDILVVVSLVLVEKGYFNSFFNQKECKMFEIMPI